ncbi:restriction endonuclease subunit S [Streptomyces sp. H39-S7]|uniref:restriction endonuclease subunit S n=1 Tax=Streptomyces sp. H39-S7 TaxID=3004357 RepID=UPI0022AE7DFF|nr:restriction endonuclease subunit S [Streptomyces sp. H39-S7]MCZ4125403.1 restriction endonuclease subunit S [Streptomyces sp. H39-S7]
MSYVERPLADALMLARNFEKIQDHQRYKITGIYSFGKGLIQRPEITGTETAYSALHRLSVGQVVMSKLNAWEGAIALVGEKFDGTYVSPEYPVFDIDTTGNDERFLAHLISWPRLWEQLTPRGSMVRRKRTTPDTFLSTKVPLPGLTEQYRVAGRLDSAMAKLSRAGELRRSTTRDCDALRESLISTANKATTHPLDAVMTLTRRPVEVSASAKYQEIGLRSFGRGVFHKPPISGAELGAKKIFRIEPGDLLFSSVFAWEGAVARAGAAEMDRVGSHRFMTYAVNPSIADADYLRFYFLSAPGLEILRRCSPGGAGRNKTLGIKPFAAEIIPLPLLSEQQKIARVLLSAEAISRNRGPVFDAQIQATRTALLNAAFTGKL